MQVLDTNCCAMLRSLTEGQHCTYVLIFLFLKILRVLSMICVKYH